MTKESVVVTGASTGIGWGISSVLVNQGFNVFGSVRTRSDADRLIAEFGKSFTPLLMDVTDQTAVVQSVDQVSDALGRANLRGLVNNAGISMVGPLLHQPLADVRRQLEVNLISPLLVTQAFASLLGSDHTREGSPGRIINISSVSGKMGAPYVGAYTASKHGLEGMSESLRRELMTYGIDVILIAPGYVNTRILDKAQSEDYAAYRHTDYGASLEQFRKMFIAEGRKGLSPLAIGDVVHTALTVRRPKTCYTVVQHKFWNWTLPNLLPKRLLDRLIGRQLGLRLAGKRTAEKARDDCR